MQRCTGEYKKKTANISNEDLGKKKSLSVEKLDMWCSMNKPQQQKKKCVHTSKCIDKNANTMCQKIKA